MNSSPAQGRIRGKTFLTSVTLFTLPGVLLEGRGGENEHSGMGKFGLLNWFSHPVGQVIQPLSDEPTGS